MYRLLPSLKDEQDEQDDMEVLPKTKTAGQDDLLLGGPVHRKFEWPSLLNFLLAASLWAVSITVAIYISKQSDNCDLCLTGVFDTELRPIQSAIEVQKVRSLGNLILDENITLTETFWNTDVPKYFGEPSDELDARWDKLIKNVSVELHGIEAETIRGKTYEKPEGGSIVGIEVFHQLHCLDLVRQALHPDYYTKHDPEPEYTTHINHCLDHLRQAIICHADVTPVPFFWDEKHDTALPDFQVEHTCRNFWKLRNWATERTT